MSDSKLQRGFRIDKMIDKTDNFTTKKGNNLFDLSFRLLLIARSGQGKSSILGNLLLKKNGYRNDFEPEKIFIFSGSLKGDAKLKTITEELDVPDENLFDGYDDDMISVVYDMLVEDFCELVDDGETRPKKLNSLIIFDDLAFTDAFKSQSKENMIKKIFMNGRKFNISVIVISQKYTSVGTILRENMTGLMIGQSSGKQLASLEADHNYLKTKKEFIEIYRKATNEPFGMFVINFSKPQLYFNKNFKPLIKDL